MSHYETLGVSPDADTETIRARYRDLARRCHPDRLGPAASRREVEEAEEMMSRLNAAWDVLGDPRSRAAYDRSLGIAAERATPGTGTGRPQGPSPERTPEDGVGEFGDEEEEGTAVVGVARLLIRFAPPWFVFSFAVLVISAVMESESLRALALFGLLGSLVMFLIAPLLVMGSTRPRGEASADGSRPEPDC